MALRLPGGVAALGGMAHVCDALVVAFMAALVGVSAAGVVSRYVEGSPLAWTDEVAATLFAGLTFFGAASGVWRAGHPRVGLLVDRLRGGWRKAAEAVRLGLMAAFLGVVIQCGAGAAQQAADVTMTSLPVSQMWSYAIVPVASGLMLVFAIGRFLVDGADIPQVALAVATPAVCWLLGFFQPGGGVLYVYAVLLLAAALLLGVPVAFALGVSAVLLLDSTDLPLDIVPQRLFDGTSNVVLMAIPLFILTGTIMSTGGMAARLAGFATAVFGGVRGGLGIADIAASVVFADISGSAVADTAAIGSVMIPQLVARGYAVDFAAALQAAAGSLGLLFPPSSTMIVYAWVTNTSVAAIFLHSFVPGLMVAGSFAALSTWFAWRRSYPREAGFSWRVAVSTGRMAIFALLAPVLILVSILGGLTTPAEAGVVAALYSVVVSCCIYRSLPMRALYGVTLEASLNASRVTFIIAAAVLLGWVLTAFRGPQQVGAFLLGVTHDRIAMLVLVNVLMVVLHTMLEGLTTILVLVPVLVPMLQQLGVDLNVFGIIMAQNCALGLLMPPLGFNLYIISGIAGISSERVAAAVVPFVLVLVFDIGALIVFPGIATWLPGLLAPG